MVKIRKKYYGTFPDRAEASKGEPRRDAHLAGHGCVVGRERRRRRVCLPPPVPCAEAEWERPPPPSLLLGRGQHQPRGARRPAASFDAVWLPDEDKDIAPCSTVPSCASGTARAPASPSPPSAEHAGVVAECRDGKRPLSATRASRSRTWRGRAALRTRLLRVVRGAAFAAAAPSASTTTRGGSTRSGAAPRGVGGHCRVIAVPANHMDRRTLGARSKEAVERRLRPPRIPPVRAGVRRDLSCWRSDGCYLHAWTYLLEAHPPRAPASAKQRLVECLRRSGAGAPTPGCTAPLASVARVSSAYE